MYHIFIKPLLFLLSPETAHRTTVSILKVIMFIPGVKRLVKNAYSVDGVALGKDLFGITFPSPIGLAAGFDKDAELFEELACFGFGFVEVGTVTPRPQSGNDKPRLFRLPQDESLINRMGFNNHGVEVMADRLKKRKPGLIIGGNIGKNKLTPNENAIEDYEISFNALHPYVDYFVVNVSSPNTPGLRELQEKAPLTVLLRTLKELDAQKDSHKPILLKIAPDLMNDQLDDIIDIIQETGTDGVIATNTTVSREGLKTPKDNIDQIGNGGLSGKAVRAKSTEVIRYIAKKSNKAFPIIGVGGIHSPEDAIEKLEAGADLVQVYTGFIYEGPGLIKRINKALMQWKK